MGLFKCPSCGKRLEAPPAFSGELRCPECQGRIPVIHGLEARHCPSCSESLLSDTTRCWKCGASTADGAKPGETAEDGGALHEAAISPGVVCAPGMSVPGCVTGIALSALGFVFGSWAVFLIPVGLLVSAISAFSEEVYRCQACGKRLDRGDLKACPFCGKSLMEG